MVCTLISVFEERRVTKRLVLNGFYIILSIFRKTCETKLGLACF